MPIISCTKFIINQVILTMLCGLRVKRLPPIAEENLTNLKARQIERFGGKDSCYQMGCDGTSCGNLLQRKVLLQNLSHIALQMIELCEFHLGQLTRADQGPPVFRLLSSL